MATLLLCDNCEKTQKKNREPDGWLTIFLQAHGDTSLAPTKKWWSKKNFCPVCAKKVIHGIEKIVSF